MLQYIPYDIFQFIENDNAFKMWSKYKIDVMRSIGEDFIHIDPDVSLFEPLIDPFVKGECDIIVQDVVSRTDNSIKKFVFDNLAFFADTKILTKPFDGRAISCGTVGINKYAQEYYFAGIDVLYEAMLKCGLENIDYPTLILEEQLLYLLAVENDFKIHEILPYSLISNEGFLNTGDKFGYLHLWRDLKYKRDIINMIRKKIFFDYPEYFDHILKYERDVLSGFEFFKHMKLPKAY